MLYVGCRRQASAALDSRSELQSPHAPSPTSTAKQSQFSEDRAGQPSARSSLDTSADPATGTPTTSGKAADQQRQQPAQVRTAQHYQLPDNHLNMLACTLVSVPTITVCLRD